MSVKVLQDLDFGGIARVTNLGAPQGPNDAARQADLDAAIQGLNWKDNVRVATQSNIDLASPGATIDGVTMNAGDRVLVKAQTTAAENGIYVWNGATVAMTRAQDADTADELENAITTVDEGTDAGTSWRQQAVNFTLGTDPVTWGSFGTGAPSATETTAGIAEIATQAETDTGTDDQRFITPLKLANWAGRKRKYTADIGDGSATQYTVTHNLGSRDVQVDVYRNTAPYDSVMVDIERPDVNSVVVRFASAPSTNQFRVVVLG